MIRDLMWLIQHRQRPYLAHLLLWRGRCPACGRRLSLSASGEGVCLRHGAW